MNRQPSFAGDFYVRKFATQIKICLAVLGMLLLLPVIGNAATLRAFFIGNSFTYQNDLPALVREIAAAAVEPDIIEIDKFTIGGSDLQIHWEDEDNRTKNRITQGGPWDYIVMQAYWACRSERTVEDFYKHVRLWDDFNINQNAKSLLWISWPGDWWGKEERYTKLVDSSRNIGAERSIPLGFAAQAFAKAEGEPHNIDPYLRGGDNHHAHVTGTYLAACMVYIILTDKNPVGSTFAPPDLRVDAGILQQIAWETHQEKAATGPVRVTEVEIMRIE